MKRDTVAISPIEVGKQDEFLGQLADYSERFRKRQGRYPTYHVRTFGCQQNEADSEVIAGMLTAAGFEETNKYETADITVINTCSVRENADNHLFGHLGILKTLYRKNKSRLTVLCGCMFTQKHHVDKIKKSYSFVNLIFAPQDMYRFPQMLFKALDNTSDMQVAVSDFDTMVEGLPIQRKRKHRALISIMYGCDHYCTYCIVPYTRGRERSRMPSDILAEVREVAEQGFPEVMLLGQNVNAWGKDFNRREIFDQAAPEIRDFADLLRAIAAIPGIRRIRYMSPYPRDFTQKVIEAIGDCPSITPHIHLPLQSGSNQVLRRMRRGYDRDKFLDIVRDARAARPGISITTDIIVGFPGETDADFEDTLDLMEKVRFDSAFTFIYSPRPGTPAAEYTDQVDEKIVSERFERLLALQNQHSLESNKQLEGERVEVLLEGTSTGDPNVLTGRTADFKLINCELSSAVKEKMPAEAFSQDALNSDFFEGKFAMVDISKAKTFSLEGELIELQC